MILFYGKNRHGLPIKLAQHYTQLNVLLTALPRLTDEPRRIGFELRQRLEKAARATVKPSAPD
jgi:hypothetical protein